MDGILSFRLNKKQDRLREQPGLGTSGHVYRNRMRGRRRVVGTQSLGDLYRLLLLRVQEHGILEDPENLPRQYLHMVLPEKMQCENDREKMGARIDTDF